MRSQETKKRIVSCLPGTRIPNIEEMVSCDTVWQCKMLMLLDYERGVHIETRINGPNSESDIISILSLLETISKEIISTCIDGLN